MNDFLAQFEDGPARHGGWTLPLRRAAIDHLAATGFPGSKNEDWKYTPVGPILEPHYHLLESQRIDVPRSWLEPAELRLVFFNGRFVRELSTAAALPEGAVVEPLSEGLLLDRTLIEPHLGQPRGAFAGLNTAFMEDGAFVLVPTGASLTVQLLFVIGPGRMPIAVHPRNLIVLGADAEANVLETHTARESAEPYLDNVVTEAVLGEGARLRHFQEQLEAPRAFHVGRLEAHCASGSRLLSYALSMGSRLARSEVIARLVAPRASCELDGLYVGRQAQHLDTDTRIEHLSSACRSRELFHGILDGHARGIFTGRVVVTPDAQQTDAGQTNRNLLLSDDAEAKTRPHLQILADDVKCSHAATVGQLDDDALFYLRSRGIPESQARGMLTWAFATAVTAVLPIRSWRQRAERRLAQWLEAAP